MCISNMTGINLVYHELASLPSVRITYEIYLLMSTLIDKDNPSSDTLLSDNSSKLIAKKLLLKGSEMAHALHARTRSPNLTIKMLISSETHVM